MLLATLPPPHRKDAMKSVINHPLVDGVRFNVGARTPYSPRETLERILEEVTKKGKEFWLDIKGRQLRITRWAVPTYGDIVLNHRIAVDLPATIWFRGGEYSQITEVRGNKIYVDPPPRQAVGEGQAVNIHGNNLRISGYLTDEDQIYIESARELGIRNFMLSFVEEKEDLVGFEGMNLICKIESIKGIEFIKRDFNSNSLYTKNSTDSALKPASPHSAITSCSANKPASPSHPDGSVGLMAARDDLYINTIKNKWDIFSYLDLIIKKDPSAILASRILTSLETSEEASLQDLSDLLFMYKMGYRNFLLSDGLCFNPSAFISAMKIFSRFKEMVEK